MKWILSVVSVAALLGVAGCGCSDDDDDGAGSAGSAGSDTAGAGGGAGRPSVTGGREDADDDQDTGGSSAAGETGTGGSSAGNGGNEAGQGGVAGAAGASADSGGTTNTNAGSAGTSGSAGEPAQAGGGQGPTAGSGTGGTTQGVAGGGGDAGAGGVPEPATLEDLVGAICDWEFRCCDRGELDYRLGAVVADAAACRARFVQQLSSNATDNPYVAGEAALLLGTLAYTIDLERVTVDTANLDACIAQYEAKACNAPVPPVAPRCTGPVDAPDPCAITSLFQPRLQAGERCTYGLRQNATNDVECVVGTTCLDADEGSPEAFPTCVTRGLIDDFCTEDSDCDFDLYCSAAGVCAEKAGVGEECQFTDEEEPIPGVLSVECKQGLACNPVTGTCTEYCADGYICSADSQCPENQSCAPLSVPTSSQDNFHACRVLGDSAADACDDDSDCELALHCDSQEGVCVEDGGVGDPCGSTAGCEDGLYCADNGECTPYAEVNDECERGSSGDPAVVDACSDPERPRYCVYDVDADETVCANQRLELEAECETDSDCESGLCERARNQGNDPVCVAGAAAGDECDGDSESGDALRCGVGLSCVESVCVALALPGENCEADGAASPGLCANGDCQNQWESFMCSDIPVPVVNGGSGVTCDGGEAEASGG